MSFTKITNTQLNSRGATTLPNQPTISATALKEEFDAPAKEIVAPAVNNLIDELQAVTSAASLGAVAPTGRTGATVQALLTDISDDLGVVEGSSHTHTNKAQLDKISEDGSGNPLYDGNPIGAGATWGDITGTLSNQTDLQTALNGKANSSHSHTKSDISDFPTLATVATSGNYNDLSNKPSIPTVTDTYSGTSSDGMSGKAVKSAIDNITYPVNDAYKNIKVTSGGASTTITASNEDEFELEAGSNITLTATGKSIKIDSTGGGGGGGTSYTASKGVTISGSDIEADLKGYTAGSEAAAAYGSTANRTYAVGLDSNNKLAVNIPLSAAALSGSYGDLTGKPSLSAVATSGSYNDLSDKPTIPAAPNSGALNIKQNGISAYTGGTSFNANSSSAATADIITSDWIAESYADSGSITFTFDDTTYTSRHGFAVYIDITSSSVNKSPYAKLTGISGEGTASCTLTYATDADNGSSANKNAFLRRIK